jgi:apolipoprotein N-acyltransferase
VTRTAEALAAAPGVDLVVWSETMMPELNRAARALTRGLKTTSHDDYGQFLEDTHAKLQALARSNKAGLLVGAIYHDEKTVPDPAAPEGVRYLQDRRNTAFLYDRTGHMSDDPADRYDKIHIVPFGEYLPFKGVFPPLYKLILSLSPYDEEYFLTAGDEGAMMAFRLEARPRASAPATEVAASGNAWRFVTPICFEDIDPLLVGKMVRGPMIERKPAGKTADFIVNITNDGWFKANQMPQHLQAARFRSIENRTPTARSVNTGISGFIDSVGRTYGLIPAGREGTSVQRLTLDARVTLYTRWGDVFAALCSVATVVVIGLSVTAWWTRRRGSKGE